MEKPVYLNLHSWDDYAIYRSLRTLPIPSPRVWDNARRFGWSKGNYKKDRFFDESLFTHELSIGTKKMFGGDLMMFNHFSGCPPSNLESKKNKSKEFSKLLLNLEKFERSKLIRIPLDFDAMNQAVKRIYSIFPRKEGVNSDFIDVGFCAEEELELEYQEKGTSEYNWTYLNDLLDEELIAKNKITIEKFYEIFEASFNYPSVELKEIGRTLENDYWFIEMFLYSFRPKIFESIMREKIIPKILNSSPLTSDQTSSFDYEGSDAYKLLKFEKKIFSLNLIWSSFLNIFLR